MRWLADRLCAIALLATLLREAEGRVHFRIVGALKIVLAGTGGFPHAQSRRHGRAGAADGVWPTVAGIHGAALVVGGCGGAFPDGGHRDAPDLPCVARHYRTCALDGPTSLVVNLMPTAVPAHQDPRRGVAGAARRLCAGNAGDSDARAGAALGW